MTAVARASRRIARHPVVRLLGVLAVGAVVLVMAIWTLPALLNRQPTTGTTAAERLTAVNSTRSAMVTLLAATAALGTLVYTVRTYALSRVGQVTDRYTKAVDQLGEDKPAIRIGGIYALERIARDSPADQPAVADVLAAFVRAVSAEPRAADAPPEDIQAALIVLGRRGKNAAERPLNLRGSDLRGVDLASADLCGARLDAARLEGARLIGADLRRAVLTDAWLDGALLADAKLQDADLTGASLVDADLYRAHVRADQLTDDQILGSRNAEHLVRYEELTSKPLPRT
jgi:hypothetical protein